MYIIHIYFSNKINCVYVIKANKILQVTVCKNWSNMGHVLANYKIKFSGLYPKNSHDLCCLSSQPYKLEVGSYLRNEDCEPTIVYKRHIQPLRLVFIVLIKFLILTLAFSQSNMIILMLL